MPSSLLTPHSTPLAPACSTAQSHNVFEMWLHPDRYRTQICIQGTACNRQVRAGLVLPAAAAAAAARPRRRAPATDCAAARRGAAAPPAASRAPVGPVVCSHARVPGSPGPAGRPLARPYNRVAPLTLPPARANTTHAFLIPHPPQICFFAHTPEELRRPPCKSPHAADGASRRASSAGGGGAAAVSTTAATSTAGGSRRDQGRAPSSASGASGAARDAPPRAPRLSIPATRSGEWPAAAAAALGLSPPQQAAPSEFEGAFSAATSAVAAVAAAGGTAADEERAAFAAARAQVERQRRAAAAAAAAAAASTAQAMAALGADASAWALLNGPHAAAAVAAVTAGLRSGPLPLPPPHHGGGRGPPPGALSAPLPRLDSAGGAAGGRCSAQGPPSGPLRAPYSAYVLPPLPPPGPELLAMLYGSQPPSGPLPGADAPRGAGRAGPDVWCAPPPDDGMWQTVRGSTVWDDRMRSGCGFAGLLASGPSLLSAPIGGLHLQVGPLGRGPEGPDLASEPLPTWPPAGVAFGGRGGAFGGWADAGCGV